MGLFNKLFGKKEDTQAEAAVQENSTEHETVENSENKVETTKAAEKSETTEKLETAEKPNTEEKSESIKKPEMAAKTEAVKKPETTEKSEIVQNTEEKTAAQSIRLQSTANEAKKIQVAENGDLILNKQVKNVKLNDLLAKRKDKKTDSIMNEILGEFAMNGLFLCAVLPAEEPKENESGQLTIDKGTPIKIPLLNNGDGKKFYPVFTDWIDLRMWAAMKDPKTMILNFDDYVRLLDKNQEVEGLVINPFSDNLLLNRKIVNHLRSQKELLQKEVAKQRTDKPVEIQLGIPKEYPVDMTNQIAAYLDTDGHTKRAWLLLMRRNDRISYLIVLDSNVDVKEQIRGVAEAAKPFAKGMHIDLVSYSSPFGMQAAAKAEPFYQKRS